MSTSLNSTAINSTNSAPYLTSDRTELAPLCNAQQDTRGLRIVISCLTVFTVLVSMALMTQLHRGDYQVVPHGSVVSDNSECSAAGVAVMKKGGSAVDAVISTLFCLSVVSPHLVGIGGGGYMLVYDQRKRSIVGCLDFQASLGNSNSSIGVPGFVAGLYQAHKSFGKLPWSSLLNAAIEMAGTEFIVSASLQAALSRAADRKELKDLLMSGHNFQLVSTLQTLALNGSDELYSGSLSSQLTQFVNAEDLAKYRVLSDNCVETTIGHYKVAVAGSNSGGPTLLSLLLKINQTLAGDNPILTVASSLRETPAVSKPYSSGVNVVAVDHNDIYVSAVCGLGSVLGSLELTSGGYVMNDMMAFSSTRGGREESRPDTLATPVVATQTGSACGNRIVMGASDMRDAAQLLVELLRPVGKPESDNWLSTVSDYPRARLLHSKVLLEDHMPRLDDHQVAELGALNLTVNSTPGPYPTLNIIHKFGDTVTAVADSRGDGAPASF
ncbi:glutathione hydrolase 7-like isoform X1 [Homalodisca vitripennis]|uniref:glutathione hydrolase 7-like isoform X1 n=1 Tax=Homalodisca vitripennis TaxID=197043 RepID=UPI001EEC0AAE|nr:glutathione hydrolase 7-like isoform X1 [Homalodisca vitripennis]